MGNYTTFLMFENPRRGRQARNFTENDPKILDLKSSSEQIIFRTLSLGAPVRLSTSRINRTHRKVPVRLFLVRFRSIDYAGYIALINPTLESLQNVYACLTYRRALLTFK